jgi:hypothetical protein
MSSFHGALLLVGEGRVNDEPAWLVVVAAHGEGQISRLRESVSDNMKQSSGGCKTAGIPILQRESYELNLKN